jgi:hypothetical protein
MRILTQGRREILSDKLFDLGNLALASLVFGFFISENPLPYSTLVLGIITATLSYTTAISLKKRLFRN